jgi:DNA-binding response OmpR family regulator
MKPLTLPNLSRPYSKIYAFKTILLVDDDQQLAETLQWILAGENFLVDVAHDGGEAMLKVSAVRYDAVVCDIMMPRMRGDEFYSIAVELSPELKRRFVFITSFENDPRVRDFLSKTGETCLVKPFPVQKLIDCIRGLFGASGSHCG